MENTKEELTEGYTRETSDDGITLEIASTNDVVEDGSPSISTFSNTPVDLYSLPTILTYSFGSDDASKIYCGLLYDKKDTILFPMYRFESSEQSTRYLVTNSTTADGTWYQYRYTGKVSNTKLMAVPDFVNTYGIDSSMFSPSIGYYGDGELVNYEWIREKHNIEFNQSYLTYGTITYRDYDIGTNVLSTYNDSEYISYGEHTIPNGTLSDYRYEYATITRPNIARWYRNVGCTKLIKPDYSTITLKETYNTTFTIQPPTLYYAKSTTSNTTVQPLQLYTSSEVTSTNFNFKYINTTNGYYVVCYESGEADAYTFNNNVDHRVDTFSIGDPTNNYFLASNSDDTTSTTTFEIYTSGTNVVVKNNGSPSSSKQYTAFLIRKKSDGTLERWGKLSTTSTLTTFSMSSFSYDTGDIFYIDYIGINITNSEIMSINTTKDGLISIASIGSTNNLSSAGFDSNLNTYDFGDLYWILGRVSSTINYLPQRFEYVVDGKITAPNFTLTKGNNINNASMSITDINYSYFKSSSDYIEISSDEESVVYSGNVVTSKYYPTLEVSGIPTSITSQNRTITIECKNVIELSGVSVSSDVTSQTLTLDRFNAPTNMSVDLIGDNYVASWDIVSNYSDDVTYLLECVDDDGNNVISTYTKNTTVNIPLDFHNQVVSDYHFTVTSTLGEDRSESNKEFDSDPSTVVTLEIQRLESPKITLSGSTLSWDAIDLADTYTINLTSDKASHEFTTSETTVELKEYLYSINEVETASWTISAISKSNDKSILESESYTCVTVLETIKLETPAWAFPFEDGNDYYFTSDANSVSNTMYTRAKTDGSIRTIEDITSPHTIDLQDNLYEVTFQSFGNELSVSENPIYMPSDVSEAKNFGQFQDIYVERYDGTLTWNDVGASYYIIYDVSYDGTFDGSISTVFGTSYQITKSNGLGYHEYYVIGYDDNGENTKESINRIEVTVQQIATPSIAWQGGNTSILEWSAETNTRMDVYVNNSLETIVYDDSVIISRSAIGTYFTKAKRVHTSDRFQYNDSEFSEVLTYEVLSLNRIENVTVDFSLSTSVVISWDALAYPETPSYGVYINDNVVGYTNSTSYTYPLTGDSNNYKVTILGTGDVSVQYPNPKVLSENYSYPVYFGKLSTPEIELDVTTIKWDEIENATSYDIYNFGTLLASTSVPYYELDLKSTGSYSVYIIATNYDENMVDSDASNIITTTVLRLNTPTGIYLENNTLHWSAVNHAELYEVYINDVLYDTVTINELDFTSVLASKAGNMKISIIATTSDNAYLDSFMSDYATFYNEMTYGYHLSIGEELYEIQLPFTFNRSLSEVLSTAALTVGYTTRSEEFQMLEPADITIVPADGSNSITWKMLIIKDEVDEIYVGNDLLYLHKLNLIERTALLQNEILPNFSITQPLTYGIASSTRVQPKHRSDRDFFSKTDQSSFWTGRYPIKDNWLESGFLRLYGTHSDTGLINEGIYSIYNVGDSIELPYDASVFWEYETLLDSQILTRNIAVGHPPYLYKIRKHVTNPSTSTDTYLDDQKDSTNPEIIIGSTSWNTSAPNLKYTVTETGLYDIIVEIPEYNLSDKSKSVGIVSLANDSGIVESRTVELEDSNQMVDFMVDKGETEPSKSQYKPYRVVYESILFTENAQTEETLTVYEVIQKAINILTPIDFGGTVKYVIDDDTDLRTKMSIVCPEMDITNGKSFYEFLVDMGKLFNGIPVLKDYDNTDVLMISFFIPDTASDYHFATWNNFEDTSELKQTNMELSRYADGYISNVQNMIPEKRTVKYPAFGKTKARGDSTAAIIDIQTMSIVLDRPIYRLKSLKVSNFTTNSSTECQLVDADATYVVENTLFNALTTSQQSQLLTYTQGDSKIINIGQMTELESIFASALGMSSTEYVIDRIIKNKMGYAPNKKPTEYLYEVEYEPYIDCVTFTENDKKTEMKYGNYQNFNQTDNVISDTRFGSNALTQIRRLGTPTLDKAYKTTDLNKIPLLGYSILDDNSNKYYIDTIQYNFYQSRVDSAVTYSRSFSKIDPSMKIDSSYREYEYPQSGLINRNININEYCYVSKTRDTTDTNDSNGLKTLIDNMFVKDSSNKVALSTEMNSFYINCYKDYDENRIEYVAIDNDGVNVSKKVEGIVLSTTCLVTDNSIQYVAKMEDNFSAGQAVSSYTDDDKNLKWYQDWVRYVSEDANAQLPYIKMSLLRIDDTNSSQYYENLPETYPSCYWWNNVEKQYASTTMMSRKIQVDKDYREVLNFSYQLHFVSDTQDMEINTGITSNLIKEVNTESVSAPIWVGIKYDIGINTKATGATKIADYTYNSATKFISSPETTILEDYESYALVWDNGSYDIILHFDTPLKTGETVTLGDVYLNIKTKKYNS